MSIFPGFVFFKMSGLRVLSCMSIFQILICFGFLGSDDDSTETPDPGQPPLPGTKYLVRISPHFDYQLIDVKLNVYVRISIKNVTAKRAKHKNLPEEICS